MAGHAGAVPMNLRHDALAAAAEMILGVEGRARDEDELVATVGRLDVEPGAVNVIPGLARFSIDIRAPRDERRRRAVADIAAALDDDRGPARRRAEARADPRSERLCLRSRRSSPA